MKILHIVGGSFEDGAFKGASILHNSLKEFGVKSKILNNNIKNKIYTKNKLSKDILFIQDSLFKRVLKYLKITFEKILKTIFLPTPRSTFTFGFFGEDLTKCKAYKDADIIHIHWIGQGFIDIYSLSKINKPVVWTLRDMWAFTGGAHYLIDFPKYEKSFLSKIVKNIKKKSYPKHIKFIAISNWLRTKAQESYVLSNFDIKRIYNNIDLDKFKIIPKNDAKRKLNISTSKKIILYGAQNSQSKRKGWKIFSESLKNIDTSKYFLLIFGKFWSENILDEIGIEYKTLGYVNDSEKMNCIYNSADAFIFTSLQEAFGKTWAEAMTCGLPVVCFENTSASEIVEHKIDGFVVNEINPVHLRNGIEWVLNNLEKRKELDQPLEKKISNFDPKNVAAKYMEIYKSLK